MKTKERRSRVQWHGFRVFRKTKEIRSRLGGMNLGFRVLGRQRKEGLRLGDMGLGF
jgi:hypothetical protein